MTTGTTDGGGVGVGVSVAVPVGTRVELGAAVETLTGDPVGIAEGTDVTIGMGVEVAGTAVVIWVAVTVGVALGGTDSSAAQPVLNSAVRTANEPTAAKHCTLRPNSPGRKHVTIYPITPFVLGTPPILRSSCSDAARNARASALKIASAL